MPVTPIATPMSASLQCGGVVYPIAGHGDDMTFLLQGLDDGELVLRRDPRVDGHLLDETLQLLAGDAGEVPSHQDAPVFDDAELGRDVAGGQGMVARDHHGSDARSFARLYGIFGLGPGRVDHTDHAHEGQVTLELIPGAIERLQAPQPHAQNANAVPRKPLVCGRDPLSPFFVRVSTRPSPLQTWPDISSKLSMAPLVKAT